jgi:hypothetical protein
MTVLIDRERMCVLYKHTQNAVLHNLAHIEVAHSATVITDGEFGLFTDLELKLLFQNTSGLKYTGFGRHILLETVKALIESIPDSDVKPFEVYMQANCIKEGDDEFYRYTPGSQVPMQIDELFTREPLVCSANYTPALPSTHAAKTAHSAVSQAQTVPSAPLKYAPPWLKK